MKVGRYSVVRRIGSGAFATVWLGHDDQFDLPVAIKILAENWAENADVNRRFVDEARALRQIHDPRLVAVHDAGRLPDGRGYFVMDYADAGTLAELVGPDLALATALAYAVEAADAVQTLHDHGLLHRDLKPSNLLRHRDPSGRERLLLADLGMAKALDEASGLTMTAGTPAYMAPEQASGQPLDARADVYGLAAVAYALITGRPPFAAERGVTDVALRDPGARPDPVGVAAVDAVLGPALAHDREHRPRTAGDLGRQLADCLDDRVVVSVTSPDPVDPVARRGLTVGRLLVVLAAVFLVTVGLGWLVWGWVAI